MSEVVHRISGLSPERLEVLRQRLGRKAANVGNAIPRRPGSETLAPLSYSQERLWLIDQLWPGSSAYNMPGALRIAGALCLEALRASLVEIVRRQETLRTRFSDSDGTPWQEVLEASLFQLREVDLDGLEQMEREPLIRRLVEEDSRRPFELSEGLPFRATLVTQTGGEYVLATVTHHIASDGWSMGIFNRETNKLYDAFSRGEASPLLELGIQYGDYSAWQRTTLSGDKLEQMLAYWRDQLSGLPPLLELPTDRARQARPASSAGSVTVKTSSQVNSKLKETSRRQGVTPFMTALAAFAVMLFKYSGQEDVVIGTPTAGRQRRELEELVGFFVNTLVLRIPMQGNPTFSELVDRVRAVCLGAYSHQEMPFEKLVEELHPERNLSHNPIFQVMFVMQNAPKERAKFGDLRVKRMPAGVGSAKFDLQLTIGENLDALWCEIEYNPDLFDAAAMARMGEHFSNILESAVVGTDKAAKLLSMLGHIERDEITGWAKGERRSHRSKWLHECIESQGGSRPDSVAVDCEGSQLSYRELSRKSNRLAWRLRELGAGLETPVGIFSERSIELVVGLLGILKSGGAFVPLEPSHPAERLEYIRAESGAQLVVAQRHVTKPGGSSIGGKLVELEEITEGSTENTARDENPGVKCDGDNLAYIIYTSGSTGRPKGAMNTHRGIENRIMWMQDEYGLEPGECVLQKTPISFDVSVWEFFWPLTAGGRLMLARPGGHRDSEYLAGLIKEKNISTVHFVPSMLDIFIAEDGLAGCGSLKRVICSGEALSWELMKKFRLASTAELHNLYGPTEAAIEVTKWQCEESAEAVRIGRPIANVTTHVLDDDMELTPAGVTGELYLGGVAVGRGYLGRGDLTAERFGPDGIKGAIGERLYRTGDAVKWTREGDIEYLGRKDQQVKIRGYRIEPGEIEGILREQEDVNEAVVMVRGDERGDSRLVAYIVPRKGSAIDASGLREYLKKKLPVYMVPAGYVLMERLPLTGSGKIDRKGLPPEDGGIRGDDERYVAPRTATEEVLCGILGDVLRMDRVGVCDSFFDLGGHSMLAVRLIARIEKQFGTRLGLSTLIEEPTVEQLAKRLQRPEATTNLSLPVAIQVGGSLRPFFCVHPAGGHVLRYRELARHLGPDQPFYGFQASGLDDDRSPHDDVRSMASDYVAQMMSIQPKGPFCIGGWSFGGIVAFEMAQQLCQRGAQVAFLALLDPTNLKTLPYLESEGELPVLLDFAQDLGIPRKQLRAFLERHPNLALSDPLREVLSQAHSWNLLPAEVELPRLVRHFDVFKTNLTAARRYVAYSYPGHLHIFRAGERFQNDSRDPTLGWGELAGGGLDLHTVAGNHFTMVSEPHVKVLAAELGKCLRLSPASQY